MDRGLRVIKSTNWSTTWEVTECHKAIMGFLEDAEAKTYYDEAKT